MTFAKNLLYSILLGVVLLLSGCQGDSFLESNASINESDNYTLRDGIFTQIPSEVISIQDEDESSVDLSSLPTKIVKEGERIVIRDDIAYDPDGDSLLYTFSYPFDSDGVFQTQIGDAGEYIVTITASDGTLSSSIQARVIVQAVNRPPVISGLPDEIRVLEGETIRLNPIVTDPDNDSVNVTFSGFLTSNSRETTFGDSGEFVATVTATDGFHSVSQNVSIIIEHVNRPPVFESISNVTVTEGDVAQLLVSVKDPDGDPISLRFSSPFSQDGTWQTERGDAGIYLVDISASDGLDTVTNTTTVVVLPFNTPPELDVPSRIIVSEGEMIVIDPVVYDADGDSLTITYSGFMNSSTRFADFGDSGEHLVTVTVTDGIATVSEDIVIEILRTNRPPVFIVEDIFK